MLRKSVLLALLSCAVAFAQSDRGRISGRVLDPTGATVANATIVVANPSTDLKRETNTGTDGLYLVDTLLSATYQVTASAPGFASTVISDLPLSAGQSRVLDIHLQPASLQESVTVSSGALAEVETSSASIGANVGTREVGNLPLNGRMFSQLYLLVPGASSSGDGSFNTMRFAGRANEQNTVRYDGVQAGTIIGSSPSDPTGGGASQFRLILSLENIQEFRAESTTYSAEYGRGAGGQITVVTKSGSNAFHGGLFEYLRNSYFDARNFFNPASTQQQAPLRLNQFGGSIGGPIKKDKFFFFLSQENMFQRVYAPFSEQTLSAFARSQAVPSIQPLLAAYPVGNAGPTANPYFDVVQATLSSFVNEYFGSARFDYHVNDKNNIYLRFGHEQGDSFVPNDISGGGSNVLQRAQNGTLDFTTILSPTMVNNAKLGVNFYRSRSLTQGVVKPGLDLSNVLISITGAAQSGASGIVTPTGAGSTPITQGIPATTYEYTYMDNLSWSHGSHNFKTGIEYNPRGMFLDQLGGTAYTFSSIQNFLANIPNQVNVTSTVSGPSIFFNGATGTRQGVQWFLGGFFQDEWKIRPNLTMNVGMRYDYFGPLNEKNDRIVSVDTYTGKINASGYAGFTTSKMNFAPRLAFAWSPEVFKAKTVFRIGGGYYFGAGQGEDQFQQLLNDTAAIQLQPATTPGLAYPVNPAAMIATFNPFSPTAGYTPRAYAHGYNLPEKVISYSASVQHTLPDQSVLTIAYVGSQGRNGFQRTIGNLITGVSTNPTNGAAIITRQFGDQFGEFDVKTSFGNNHYDSLQVSLNRRFAKGLTASMQYSWSHGIGTTGGSNEATTSENNYNFNQERGNNSFDIRQVLTAGGLYQLPFGKGQAMSFGGNKFADAILGGWQLGGSLNLRTGLPINVLMTRNNTVFYNPTNGTYTYTAIPGVTQAVINIPGGGQSRGTQRPDLVAGVDPYVDSSSGFWLNPAAFSVPAPGTYGNLGRNAVTGPGFAQIDTTISKQFRITERVHADLRGEIYNIANHPNWANPSAALGGATLLPGTVFSRATSASFAQISSTVGKYVNNGTNRQIQVALRLTF